MPTEFGSDATGMDGGGANAVVAMPPVERYGENYVCCLRSAVCNQGS
jgi:hypothetical protein